MANKLNAKAASFTPSFAVAPTSFNDDEMAADLENEMASSDVNELSAIMHDTGMANVAQTSTALPPHMQKHAAEFWFPQSR